MSAPVEWRRRAPPGGERLKPVACALLPAARYANGEGDGTTGRTKYGEGRITRPPLQNSPATDRPLPLVGAVPFAQRVAVVRAVLLVALLRR